jgi:hypothetical protein
MKTLKVLQLIFFIVGSLMCDLTGGEASDSVATNFSLIGQGIVRQPGRDSFKSFSYKIQIREMSLEMASLSLTNIWGKELFVSKKVQSKVFPAVNFSGDYECISTEIVKVLNSMGVAVHFLGSGTVALVEASASAKPNTEEIEENTVP